MAWISATTLDDRNANLQASQIAAILDRVSGRPQEGSVVFLSGAPPLEVKESPAQLLRAIDSEEHPENPPVPPDQAW
ncbi:MAG TPA: hypothetical protein VLE27_03175 [Thermoanaerobaculia bacterium]|jgi:hypothetical protein|nr:hypothetical protein [Thermoanaerobaculia bacterium]